MMLSRLMTECEQSGTRRFAKSANPFAAQPVRPQLQHQFVGNPGSTGLRSDLCSSEPGPDLLRT